MEFKLYHQRRLPHYQPKQGTLFITFRLNFPIPPKFVQSYNNYADLLKIRMEKQELAQQKMLFAFEDDLYDQIEADISLTKPDSAAGLLAEQILSLQGTMYYLYAFTIMPNHVHLLIKPLQYDDKVVSIAEILRKIKGVSARQINLLYNREGALWFREYYDHWVRNPQELVNIIEYIRRNPLKAKLVDDPDKWRWTWINPDVLQGKF